MRLLQILGRFEVQHADSYYSVQPATFFTDFLHKPDI